MRKLYEIFKFLKVQKRIVSAETIRGITVSIKQVDEQGGNMQEETDASIEK